MKEERCGAELSFSGKRPTLLVYNTILPVCIHSIIHSDYIHFWHVATFASVNTSLFYYSLLQILHPCQYTTYILCNKLVIMQPYLTG